MINETVQRIDFSDPREPKTVKVFHSVTSVASDDGCELIILANKEGLDRQRPSESPFADVHFGVGNSTPS